MTFASRLLPLALLWAVTAVSAQTFEAPATPSTYAVTAPAVVDVDGSYWVSVPPPAPLDEYPGYAPAGYLWVSGYWGYDGTQYIWQPGYWTLAPQNYFWVTPSWQLVHGYWRTVPGHWHPRNEPRNDSRFEPRFEPREPVTPHRTEPQPSPRWGQAGEPQYPPREPVHGATPQNPATVSPPRLPTAPAPVNHPQPVLPAPGLESRMVTHTVGPQVRQALPADSARKPPHDGDKEWPPKP